jgi:RNA polymerase sigma factor (TIGR02999 family)
MTDVTRLLDAAAAGEPQAAADLPPLVYAELRKLAAARLAAEPAGQSLQPTALVHEAYVRLVGGEQPQNWNGRGHFFAAAAEAMRRILVDHARRKKSAKYGGDRKRLDLDAIDVAIADWPEDLVVLDEALDRLAAIDPKAARLVHLRFFAGLPIPEVAEVLGMSPRTADRLWAYARAWRHQAVRDSDPTA